MTAPTIAEFILARIAEDEALAQAASRDRYSVEGALRYGDTGYNTLPDLTIDPARMLAECEAKRRIMELHESVPYWGLDRYGRWLPREGEPKTWYCECQADDGMIQGSEPCETKRILAAVYADHPDYDQAWA